ncbi:MAG: sugar transferase [Burkholderiaceae bacterium]|nr:sugar transferase [Rhodoferax sp.]MCP5284764.1 sugar transferase [Burkholderiaceae bacterium]
MSRSATLHSPLARRWQATTAMLAWRWRTHRLAWFKRGCDIAVAVVALLALAPLLAAVALAIKLYDRGPVLFWQQRVGRHGVRFAFPKFRSMCVDAEARLAALRERNQHGQDGVTFKMKHDPRITPVGRLIRRTSIDELPQLWSVLRGDMSLVGPRPALVSEVQRYELAHRERLLVTPGLTCIWQVSGRGEVPFAQQLEMDLDYIRNRSIGLDLKLLALTLPAVVGGRGAY